LEPRIIFGRGLENLQLREIVEAEAQMWDAGQIQQKIVLKCFNWWILSNLLFFLCQEERNKYYYVVIVKDSYRLIYLAIIKTIREVEISE